MIYKILGGWNGSEKTFQISIADDYRRKNAGDGDWGSLHSEQGCWTYSFTSNLHASIQTWENWLDATREAMWG